MKPIDIKKIRGGRPHNPIPDAERATPCCRCGILRYHRDLVEGRCKANCGKSYMEIKNMDEAAQKDAAGLSERDDGKCKCGENNRKEPHPCPYRADVNDDSETLCNCCTECQHQCAMDI